MSKDEANDKSPTSLDLNAIVDERVRKIIAEKEAAGDFGMKWIVDTDDDPVSNEPVARPSIKPPADKTRASDEKVVPGAYDKRLFQIGCISIVLILVSLLLALIWSDDRRNEVWAVLVAILDLIQSILH